MDWEALESAAQGADVPVPAGLEERIKENLAAQASLEARTEAVRFRRWGTYAALAVAASLAALALLLPHGKTTLRDSFNDPYLAYAQVEAAFQTISDKMALGVDLAAKAGETTGKPARLIQKINEQ